MKLLAYLLILRSAFSNFMVPACISNLADSARYHIGGWVGLLWADWQETNHQKNLFHRNFVSPHPFPSTIVFSCQCYFTNPTQSYLSRLTSTQDTRWRCLRHCTKNLKVAISIPDGIIDSLNLSGRTMELGSIQPVTEMSTMDISWKLRRPVPTSCTDCLEIPGRLNLRGCPGLYSDCFTLLSTI